ncbi:Predicted Zn-dependent peptidase [Amycolatopsis marina]|uniref:Predicted Zn-dependent peptidase n=1 Tax=Amycolatopsis marina TaxID=490629 RepID=A0A1I1BEK0_9PSEU|nr:pitrilysin family protein [Amycolatopsis marina]SFB48046.1 Predicted Zn-dependent peptidase [Amycolatopsis marina]
MTAPTREYLDTRLPNGLRVVLAPDRAVPAVCVAVSYDIGTRSEPRHQAGFAHLFEHLMFQGSANVDKLGHARLIEETGGTFNASTRADSTVYHQTLPKGGLERALFLEADRMRGPRITEANLRNQVDVVAEEIRDNVLNVPYGGFPRRHLRPVLFSTFPNAHDGYGSFEGLRKATVADAEEFFLRYYGPGNAVLVVAGDLDIEHTLRLVESYFGDVEAGETPAPRDFAEPGLRASRHRKHSDPRAPLSAFACGWRVPDPLADVEEFLAFVVLADVLGEGEQSRLARRLVHADRRAVNVGAAVNLLDDPFVVRDPTGLAVCAYLQEDGQVESALRSVDEECARVAEHGLEPGELARVLARMTARIARNLDDLRAGALWMARFAQQRDRPGFATELPGLIAGLRPEQVSAAAATLVPDRRAVVEVVPGTGT